MSGIAGIVDFSGAPIPRDLIEAMTSEMAHRGPDGINHWVVGNAALGHCMLHTTPESLTESQPLVSACEEKILVVDGRIDNWEEIRRALKLPDSNDAELFLQGLEEWGDGFPARLEGDFALAIWDIYQGRLYCARDIYGMKPFFYHWDGRHFSFASEVRAFRALPWIDWHLNENAIAEYIGIEWHDPSNTPWRGIKLLPQRRYASVRKSGPKIQEYWTPLPIQPLIYKDEREYIEHYRAELMGVTQRMLRSHQPIAFEVSGGLDSTALFTIAAELENSGALSTPSLSAYGLIFPEGSMACEANYIADVEAFTGRKVEHVPPTIQSIDWYKEKARSQHYFPSYPNGTMSYGLRKQARATGARVLISGQGGDERVGLPLPALAIADLIWLRQFRLLFKHYLALKANRSVWHTFSRAFFKLIPYQTQALINSVAGRGKPLPASLPPRLRHLLSAGRTTKCRDRASYRNFPSQEFHLAVLDDAFTSAICLPLEDIMTAEIGLERRCPFFNKRLVEFTLRTPEWTRNRSNIVKWSHREAFRDLLPDSIYRRNDKADFMISFSSTLNGISGKEIISDAARTHRNWVNVIEISKLLEVLETKPEDGAAGWALWGLIGLHFLSIHETHK